MKQYETIFIVTPLLTEEQMKEVAGKYRDYLSSNQAEIVHEESWGLMKLAYPIKKKSTGFYYLIEFRANPDLINKLEIEYKRDERIMRFLTIYQDKYAIEFSERRKRGDFNRENKKPKVKVEEEVATKRY
ncbi:MAG: 30S ribosomal protein S6 [Bacteroidetes bacterium]|nr:30S ribosomal protein S6 [Bacteroidota bacterium]